MARTNNTSENDNSDDEVILRVKPIEDTPKQNHKIYFIRSYSPCDRNREKDCEEDSVRHLKEIRSLLENNDLNILRYDRNSLIVPSVSANSRSVSNTNLRKRPVSMPFLFKHNSFLRRSFHNLWGKSFRGSKSQPTSGGSSSSGSDKVRKSSKKKSRSDNEDYDRNRKDWKRSFYSEKCAAVKEEELNATEFHRSNSTSSSCPSTRSTNSIGFGIRSAPSSPMAPLQGQSEGHGQSVISLNAIAKSPSHQSTTSKLDSKSLKQLSAVTASAARSISPHHQKSLSSLSKNDIPEKEKKRKELSSSRQKKFHRHFQQVSKDEKVINYYSCALVSDILLQGHLYITENYFAFYSNVFGFVTKLVIPTASVVRISKEKTAKIIPNAVGVATADERHVFGSFMSREAAFRLMCSLCKPLEPPEIIPKVPDVEVSEECSVEDDSSCSISGNESPPQVVNSIANDSQSLRQRTVPTPTNIVDIKEMTADIPANTASLTPCPPSTPTKLSKSPLPRIVSCEPFKLKFPTDFHIVYLGVVLTIVLALFSGFLLYRILDIEARNRNHLNYKWGSGSSEDVYAEALKWQKEMQTRSTDEAQIILNANLAQIARVRRNLEALSILIHDKNLPSSQYDSITRGHGANGDTQNEDPPSSDYGGAT